MTCPHCKHSRSRVIDSRTQSLGVSKKSSNITTYRRRECSKCHHRYSTFEIHTAELTRLRSLAGAVENLTLKLTLDEVKSRKLQGLDLDYAPVIEEIGHDG